MDANTITLYVGYLIVAVLSVVGAKFGYLDPTVSGSIITLVVGTFLGTHVPSPAQTKQINALIAAQTPTETSAPVPLPTRPGVPG